MTPYEKFAVFMMAMLILFGVALALEHFRIMAWNEPAMTVTSVVGTVLYLVWVFHPAHDEGDD